VRKGTVLTYLLADHLPLRWRSGMLRFTPRGSNSLITSDTGTLLSETLYKPWGEIRYTTGTTTTPYKYTGQYSNTADFGWMYYKARWYDNSLGRFAQPDSIVPEMSNVNSFQRYNYVDGNPIKYIDPNGKEKVIIFYGTDETTNSFNEAAETQYNKALEAGYSESDILLVQVSKDYEVFEAISNSKYGEIEQIYFFSHGWDGGLQLSSGSIPENQFTTADLTNSTVDLQNRFSENSNIYINACKVGQGKFPSVLADTFHSTVFAYTQNLKFFESIGGFKPFVAPYNGSGLPTTNTVEMSPYLGFHIGRFDISLPLPISPNKFTSN
jgi:RHS repeat-associated protein